MSEKQPSKKPTQDEDDYGPDTCRERDNAYRSDRPGFTVESEKTPRDHAIDEMKEEWGNRTQYYDDEFIDSIRKDRLRGHSMPRLCRNYDLTMYMVKQILYGHKQFASMGTVPPLSKPRAGGKALRFSDPAEQREIRRRVIDEDLTMREMSSIFRAGSETLRKVIECEYPYEACDESQKAILFPVMGYEGRPWAVERKRVLNAKNRAVIGPSTEEDIRIWRRIVDDYKASGRRLPV